MYIVLNQTVPIVSLENYHLFKITEVGTKHIYGKPTRGFLK